MEQVNDEGFCLKLENINKIFLKNSESSINQNQKLKKLFRVLIGNASKDKTDKKKFYALKDISFSLNKKESLGIIGLNGSGKSTLVQIIAKTLSPSSGNIKVKGRVAALLELGSGFNPDFTGRENAIINGKIFGLQKIKYLPKLLRFKNSLI